jgi:hypothetical protein
MNVWLSLNLSLCYKLPWMTYDMKPLVTILIKMDKIISTKS